MISNQNETDSYQAPGVRPEQRLAYALLVRGILDYYGLKEVPWYANERVRIILNPHRESARKWFESNDELYIYSYIQCCYHLNVDPKRIRDMIFSGKLDSSKFFVPNKHQATTGKQKSGSSLRTAHSPVHKPRPTRYPRNKKTRRGPR